MESEPQDEHKPLHTDAAAPIAGSEPRRPLWRGLADVGLLVLGMGSFFALSLAGMSHLSDMERCGWAGAEFALEWHSTWSRGCQLQVEGQWLGELVVREKMRYAEAEVDKRRAALVAEIQQARAQGRGEDSPEADAARGTKELGAELRKLDDARGIRRDQAGEEQGALARREFLLDYMKRERGK